MIDQIDFHKDAMTTTLPANPTPVSSPNATPANPAGLTLGTPIRPRDRDTLLQALRGGVVPRAGIHHIQVGRFEEVKALLTDCRRIADGGSAFRLVVGEYGAGKTFFLSLVRQMALESKLVTVHADLNPGRRLHGTGGQGRALYCELIKNMATRTRPDGGALASVVEKFISTAREQAAAEGAAVDAVMQRQLAELTELTNGYDFAAVIAAYWRGFDEGNEQLKQDALRWLRGEFGTRTEARAALGVRAIVDDENVFETLQVMARFCQLAGFSGMIVCIDEMVNVWKMHNTKARDANWERVLGMLNNALQGNVRGIGFVLGGTPDVLTDQRRGMYSYAALQSRLADNQFATGGIKDYTHPVVRLAALTQEDFYVLLQKLLLVHASGDVTRLAMPLDDGPKAFMEHCYARIGDATFRTPRTTIRAFLDLLAVLEQNESTVWGDFIAKIAVQKDVGGDLDAVPDAADDDELTSFRL
jgi:hypothetical protein